MGWAAEGKDVVQSPLAANLKMAVVLRFLAMENSTSSLASELNGEAYQFH